MPTFSCWLVGDAYLRSPDLSGGYYQPNLGHAYPYHESYAEHPPKKEEEKKKKTITQVPPGHAVSTAKATPGGVGAGEQGEQDEERRVTYGQLGEKGLSFMSTITGDHIE